MVVENDNQNLELLLHQDVNNLHLAANGSSHQNSTSDQNMDQDTHTVASTVLTTYNNNSKQNNKEATPQPNTVCTKPSDTT